MSDGAVSDVWNRLCCNTGICWRKGCRLAVSTRTFSAATASAFSASTLPQPSTASEWPGAAGRPVAPHLRRRRDHALVLDRPSAQQNFPMRLAGDPGKGRRHRNQFGPLRPQRTEQRGEAQIVAYGHTQTPDRRIHYRQVLPVLVGIRLAVVAVRIVDVHIEHVQLVVAGADLALFVEQQAAGGDKLSGFRG